MSSTYKSDFLAPTTSPRKILAKHGRTFWLASFFLPRKTAKEATHLYAFCRFVDDLADEVESTPSKKEETVTKLKLLLAYFSGKTQNLLTLPDHERTYIDELRPLHLPQDPIIHLLEGVLQDTEDTVLFTNQKMLLRYAYRVAGTVGILMTKLLGVESKLAIFHAIDLGIAMQLTNIARDVQADAAISRRYLPIEIPIQDIKEGTQREVISSSIKEILALSEQYYKSGIAGLAYLPSRVRPGIYLMTILYREIGRLLLRRGVPWDEGRVIVSRIRKFSLCIAALPHCLQLLFKTQKQKNIPDHHQSLHASLSLLSGSHQ
ncbi:MAG: phytoene/squalene synthase family protein [Gammaproteobacteria bacterium]|nr:phytoene/squalene synthase family protein [Gammaproteobacteria bacterium]MDG2117673.1 phytoene/squalene synthase family protein [Gammaproteobacteria bacterium]